MATAARLTAHPSDNWLSRLLDNRRFLVFLFMLPAAGLLLVFLSYPLGLGVWLAFTDTTIGRDGEFIGLWNYESLFADSVFWLSVTNTLLYTVVATVGKFILGLWLALLLNHALPFKAFIRSIVLVPWIVPTVLSAIAFWWIYDPQFSIISYVLVDVLGWRDTYIDFLGVPNHARASLIVANIWRGIPFVAICLLAGLQTISPSLYEAAMIDGANAWRRFWHVTLPLLMPILAVVLTFSVLFTFTDFQLVYAITRGGPVNSTHLMATLAYQRAIPGGQLGEGAAITRGGPVNSTHLMATLAYQRAIPGGQLGEGAAIAVAMIPFLVFATVFSYFALANRKWQQGGRDD